MKKYVRYFGVLMHPWFGVAESCFALSRSLRKAHGKPTWTYLIS